MVSKNKRFLQRMRVPLGFVFGALYLYFAHLELKTAMLGIVLSLVGVWIRGWASGHIRKNKELAISGPYAYTRNPLYLGSFIMGLGLSIGGGYWWFPVAFAILFLVIYLPVMRAEAEDLVMLFGDGFAEYAKNVPLFIPRPAAWNRSEGKFEMALYLKYREYRALLGVLAVWGILAAKMFILK